MRWNTKIIDFINDELGGDASCFVESPFFRGERTLRKANLEFDLTDQEAALRESLLKDESQFLMKFGFGPTFEPVEPSAISMTAQRMAMLNALIDSPITVVLKERQVGLTNALNAIGLMSVCQGRSVCAVSPKTAFATDKSYNVKLKYSVMPFFMKPGIHAWNQKSMDFDNGGSYECFGADRNRLIGRRIGLLLMDDAEHMDPDFLVENASVTASHGARVIVSGLVTRSGFFREALPNANYVLFGREGVSRLEGNA